MKMVKSLLLGSAAGLVAVAGAQAADLPVKAKPVEYVKICSIYGAGFFYIPGTDTCIKIGGWVRFEMDFNAGGSHDPTSTGGGGRNNRIDTADVTLRDRWVISNDIRTQTEYGTLRAYYPRRLRLDRPRRRRRPLLRRARLHPVRRLHVRPVAVLLRLLCERDVLHRLYRRSVFDRRAGHRPARLHGHLRQRLHRDDRDRRRREAP